MSLIYEIAQVIEECLPRYEGKIFIPADLTIITSTHSVKPPFITITNPSTRIIPRQEVEYSEPYITAGCVRLESVVRIDVFEEIAKDFVPLKEFCTFREQTKKEWMEYKNKSARSIPKIYWGASDNTNQIFIPLVTALINNLPKYRIMFDSNVRTGLNFELGLQNSIELLIEYDTTINIEDEMYNIKDLIIKIEDYCNPCGNLAKTSGV